MHLHYRFVSYDHESKSCRLKYEDAMIQQNGFKWEYHDVHQEQMVEAKLETVESVLELYIKAICKKSFEEKVT